MLLQHLILPARSRPSSTPRVLLRHGDHTLLAFTLRQWKEAFLGYFTTGGANNGGTESINGLIELARRVARGFRDPDNYRLRMLLIGGGLRL